MKKTFLLLFLLCNIVCVAQNLKAYKGDNGKYGYRNSAGNVVIYPSYDFANDFTDGLGLVEDLKAFMFLNEKEKRVVNAGEYDWAYPFSEGLAAVNKGAKLSESGEPTGGKWGYINTQGKLVIPLQYDRADIFNNGLAPVSIGNKYGFIDKSGKTIIPFTYTIAWPFKDGYAAVNIGGTWNKDLDEPIGGLWSFIDVKGTQIKLPIYTKVEYFSDGLALIELNGRELGNGKLGFMDKSGNAVIPPVYDDAHSFSGGLAAVNEGAVVTTFGKKGGKWGFINKSGKKVIECKYDKVSNFKNGVAVVANSVNDFGYGAFGLIDASGKEIVPVGKYEYITDPPFDPKYPIVVKQKGGKYGVINYAGVEVIPPIFDFAFNVEDGLVKVQKGKQWGYTDNTGKEIVPVKFLSVGVFENGLVHAWNNDTHAYYNRQGIEILEPSRIDTVYGIREGMLRARMRGSEVFIDLQQKKLVNKKPYDESFHFMEGMAGVMKDKKWGFIDKSGNEVIPLQYDYVLNYSEGLAGVNKGGKLSTYQIIGGGKWGFVDIAGKEIIPAKYDDIRSFSEGMAAVNTGARMGSYGMEGGRWGFVDKTGKEVISPRYTQASEFVNGTATVMLDGKKIVIDKTGREIR